MTGNSVHVNVESSEKSIVMEVISLLLDEEVPEHSFYMLSLGRTAGKGYKVTADLSGPEPTTS